MIIKNIIKNIILSFIISTIIFAIYVELSDGMGNIWYRINDSGDRVIMIESLWTLMMAPIYYRFYWWFEYFDLNFFIYWGLIFITVKYLN